MAAPTVGATVTTDNTNSGGESPTWATISHTVDTGSDLLIVFVTIGFNASRDPTTVTWNLESLTQLDAIVDGTNTRTQLWYLKSPTITSGLVRIDWSASTARIGMTAINISGNDPTTTFGTSITAVGNNNAPQVTVVSEAGELVVAGMTFRDGNGALTEGSGITERSNFDHPDQFGGETATGTKVGEAATLMDWADNTSAAWTIVGVAIKPLTAAAAARQTKTNIHNVSVQRASLF